MLDLHLPEMRQLFKDACRFQHSEFIVVEAPSNRGKGDEENETGASAEGCYHHTSETHSSAVY